MLKAEPKTQLFSICPRWFHNRHSRGKAVMENCDGIIYKVAIYAVMSV